MVGDVLMFKLDSNRMMWEDTRCVMYSTFFLDITTNNTGYEVFYKSHNLRSIVASMLNQVFSNDLFSLLLS